MVQETVCEDPEKLEEEEPWHESFSKQRIVTAVVVLVKPFKITKAKVRKAKNKTSSKK